jgi:hypothetical protein
VAENLCLEGMSSLGMDLRLRLRLGLRLGSSRRSRELPPCKAAGLLLGPMSILVVVILGCEWVMVFSGCWKWVVTFWVEWMRVLDGVER